MKLTSKFKKPGNVSYESINVKNKKDKKSKLIIFFSFSFHEMFNE
jgi:hypothetical protein